MEKNLLNNYVLDLLESIEQNISAFTKDRKPERLHRLRVNIKKIKAIFSFAENIYKVKHDATKLKQLFLKAGKIWEMHININLLGAVPHAPERLITRLKKKENILTQQFIKNSSQYFVLINDFREKVCLPEILRSKKAIIIFFNKERRKANKILQHKDRESMHQYRKKIKKMMYIYNTLPKIMQNKIELNKAEINKKQKKLGDWHDIYSAINYFSHELFPIQTSEYILKLKEKEEKQFNTLLINLIDKRK